MKRFFRGLLIIFIMAIIGGMVGGISFGVANMMDSADGIMNAIFVFPLIFIFATWLLSLPLGGLSHWDPVAYFIGVIIFAFIILIMSLNGSLTSQESFLSAIAMHATFFFMLIPKIDSSCEDYFVTETLYVDGWEVDSHSYIESGYVCGSAIKLVVIAILGLVCGLATYSSNDYGPMAIWIIFAIGVGISIFKIIQSIRAQSR